MSLIYVEGFDNIATADLGVKGWSLSNSPTVQTGTFRTGVKALSSNNRSVYIQRGLAAADESDTLILGFAYKVPALPTSEDTAIASFLSDSAATQHTTLAVTTTGALRVFRGDSTGTQLGISSAGVITAGAWAYIEFKAKLHDTTGTVDVHVNGASVLSLTGQDTKNSGTKTVYDSIRIGSCDNRNGVQAYHDDLYLCNVAGSANNTFLGDCKVQTILPNGDGNASQMVGSDGNSVSNYALVNGAAPQTVTYVGTPTTDNEDTYAFEDISSSATVFGVQINAYATKTDAGSRSLALVTRRSGTEYASSDVALPTGSQSMVRQIRETDPSTSAAWTAAGVNAAEFGVRARP